MKWVRQFEGPYLVLETPSAVTAKIQKGAKAKPKVVHVDKLKQYCGTPPRSWLTEASAEDSESKIVTDDPIQDDSLPASNISFYNHSPPTQHEPRQVRRPRWYDDFDTNFAQTRRIRRDESVNYQPKRIIMNSAYLYRKDQTKLASMAQSEANWTDVVTGTAKLPAPSMKRRRRNSY